MDVYLVGGAVRDQLLGLTVKDRDYVVVGASPEEMLALGYQQVGKDFPVFLHPKSKQEYALARTERKTAVGYHGFSCNFSPDISLEDDLLRRDLTINAIAQDQNGQLCDPYLGQQDIQDKWLRHVSPAFIEDPLRVLRVARFAARFAHLGFRIAPETEQLMLHMVQMGELNSLTPERVWQEMLKALQTQNPQVFFEVLVRINALHAILPTVELNHLELERLARVSQTTLDSKIRFCVAFYLQPELNQLGKDLRLPNEYRWLVEKVHQLHSKLMAPKQLDSAAILECLDQLDVWRQPKRFDEVLQVCEAITRSHCITLTLSSFWQQCYQVAQQVDVQTLLAKGLKGKQIKEALQLERKNKINLLINNQQFHNKR